MAGGMGRGARGKGQESFFLTSFYMAHEVFISYSSVDSTAGETVCLILEQNGISCWIAPRDITPGVADESH